MTDSAMTAGQNWLDGDAAPAVRPYAVTGGRVKASLHLDLASMVVTTRRDPGPSAETDHAQVLGLCGVPVSVAEIAGRMQLPAAVVKILIGDLVGWGSVRASAPSARTGTADRDLLERVLDGLERLC
jgi:hypothetical protein